MQPRPILPINNPADHASGRSADVTGFLSEIPQLDTRDFQQNLQHRLCG
jgi:hypothetical protein